jgi:hypothetical protein
VPKPSDARSSVQMHQIGDAVDGSIQGTVSVSKQVSNSISHEAFLFPWEEDFPTSPWEEASRSGVADTVKVPVSEVITAKAICGPFKALSLICRGFFGPRAVSSSPSGDKKASLSSKGKDPCPEKALLRRGFFGLNPISSSLPEKSSKEVVCSIVWSLGAVEVGLNPPVSKSQLVYSRRVKDEVAK